MTILSNNISRSVKDTLLFDIIYFVVFLFLIRVFTDGNQTTGMFILIGLFVVILATVYYSIVTIAIQLTGRTIGILTSALLLFVFSELAVLTLTGELPIFGLLQKHVYSKSPYSGDKNIDESIYLFRQTRDFAFSVAGVTSAIIFLVIRWFTKKKNQS